MPPDIAAAQLLHGLSPLHSVWSLTGRDISGDILHKRIVNNLCKFTKSQDVLFVCLDFFCVYGKIIMNNCVYEVVFFI